MTGLRRPPDAENPPDRYEIEIFGGASDLILTPDGPRGADDR
jgi:hypothetical protein